MLRSERDPAPIYSHSTAGIGKNKADAGQAKAFHLHFLRRRALWLFVLDLSDDKLEYTDNAKAVLLRSFSVNPRYQGKGIGKAAMLLVPAFVKQKFPGTDEIILSVNVSNAPAYALYLDCGFKQEERTVTGRSGLQYILSYKLFPLPDSIRI